MNHVLVPGFHTAALPDHDLATAGELLHGIGYGAIAVRLSLARLNPLAEMTFRQCQVELLERGTQGLEVVVDADAGFLIDPWCDEVAELAGEEARRDRRIECLLATIDLAGALERRVGRRMVTFSVGRKPDGVDVQQALDRLADGVSEILRRADGLGVQIAIRPRGGHLVDSIGRFERLVEWGGTGEKLLLAADVGVMVAGGEMPVVDLLRRAGDRLGCVYLSELRAEDSGSHYEPTIAGGHVSAARVVEGLAQGDGFAGPVIVEQASEERGTPAGAKRVLKSVFGTQNW